MQVIGKIEITLTQDMNVHTSFRLPNRQFANLMIETAKQDIIAKLIEAQQQKVVLPEPDVGSLLRN